MALVLGLLMFILFSFHLALAFTGITTWESMRWDKINYLKKFKRSPFNRGAWKNLLFFCRVHRNITQWKVPV